MKKVVLAVALAFASTAALADTANVDVYGTFNLSLENVKAVGSTDGTGNLNNRFRLTSNSSNFGIKGTDQLTSGLKGIFQVELGVDPATANGNIGYRNSGVGVNGDWGTVMFGVWDTPYKIAHNFIEPMYATGVGYYATLLDTVGAEQPSATFGSLTGTPEQRTSFSRRQGSSIQYWSPKMGGFSARLMYVPNANKSASASPNLYSGSVSYEGGGLNAAVAVEHHKDMMVGQSFAGVYDTDSTSTTATAMKAAVAYKVLEGTQVGGAFTRLNYGADYADGDASYTRNSLMASVLHKMGDITLRGAYGMAFEGEFELPGTASVDAEGSDARMATIGASYSLSKRTDLYAVGSKIWNGNAANYNFVVSSVGGSEAGADPQSIGLGIRHTF